MKNGLVVCISHFSRTLIGLQSYGQNLLVSRFKVEGFTNLIPDYLMTLKPVLLTHSLSTPVRFHGTTQIVIYSLLLESVDSKELLVQ